MEGENRVRIAEIKYSVKRKDRFSDSMIRVKSLCRSGSKPLTSQIKTLRQTSIYVILICHKLSVTNDNQAAGDQQQPPRVSHLRR